MNGSLAVFRKRPQVSVLLFQLIACEKFLVISKSEKQQQHRHFPSNKNSRRHSGSRTRGDVVTLRCRPFFLSVTNHLAVMALSFFFFNGSLSYRNCYCYSFIILFSRSVSLFIRNISFLDKRGEMVLLSFEMRAAMNRDVAARIGRK